jgi:hypothetical protein
MIVSWIGLSANVSSTHVHTRWIIASTLGRSWIDEPTSALARSAISRTAAVLSPRPVRNSKSGLRLRERLLAGFERTHRRFWRLGLTCTGLGFGASLRRGIGLGGRYAWLACARVALGLGLHGALSHRSYLQPAGFDGLAVQWFRLGVGVGHRALGRGVPPGSEPATSCQSNTGFGAASGLWPPPLPGRPPRLSRKKALARKSASRASSRQMG